MMCLENKTPSSSQPAERSLDWLMERLGVGLCCAFPFVTDMLIYTPNNTKTRQIHAPRYETHMRALPRTQISADKTPSRHTNTNERRSSFRVCSNIENCLHEQLKRYQTGGFAQCIIATVIRQAYRVVSENEAIAIPSIVVALWHVNADKISSLLACINRGGRPLKWRVRQLYHYHIAMRGICIPNHEIGAHRAQIS